MVFPESTLGSDSIIRRFILDCIEQEMYIKQSDYNKILKQIPIVCIDVTIVHDDKILLIKRKREPARGEWWLPGGRLFLNEELIDCALRKAKEEVGFDCTVDKMIHYQSTVFPDVHSVNFCYLLLADDNKVELDNTSSDYKWIDGIYEPYHPYVLKCVQKAFWCIKSRMVLR